MSKIKCSKCGQEYEVGTFFVSDPIYICEKCHKKINVGEYIVDPTQDATNIMAEIIKDIESLHVEAIRAKKRISPELDKTYQDIIIKIKAETNEFRKRHKVGVVDDLLYNRCKRCGVEISPNVYLCEGCWRKDEDV